MNDWEKEEDVRYSKLYDGGYPAGDPMRVVKLLNIPSDANVIDLGCGRATLAYYFTSLYVGVDASESVIKMDREKYAQDERKTFFHLGFSELYEVEQDVGFDWAICADVMEHIPEDHVMEVIESIAGLSCRNFAFLISTRPSYILGPSGENLHVTVHDADWWIEQLNAHFHIKEMISPARDCILFHCTP